MKHLEERFSATHTQQVTAHTHEHMVTDKHKLIVPYPTNSHSQNTHMARMDEWMNTIKKPHSKQTAHPSGMSHQNLKGADSITYAAHAGQAAAGLVQDHTAPRAE